MGIRTGGIGGVGYKDAGGFRRFGKRRSRAIISFGNPIDPHDERSGELAGDMTAVPAHNGTLDDIDGSWVELIFNDTDGGVNIPRNCSHNLYTEEVSAWADEPVVDQPNVRWFVVGWEHSGADATKTKTCWDDLRVPLSAGKATPATRPPTFGLGATAPFTSLAIWWFSQQAVNEEQLFFTTQMPHNWKEGTDILPHIHWTPDQAPGAVDRCVKWGLEYSWADVGGSFLASDTIYTDATNDLTQTEQGVPLVASDHYLSRFEVDNLGAPATMTGGTTISSMLSCRIFRNSSVVAEDDYVGDAGALEVDFHYEIDGPGSDVEYPKTADIELGWTPFSIVRNSGDAIDANNIELRLKASPFLSVTDTNPLKVTLFFIKAVE